MSLTDIQDIDKSDFYSYECLLTDEERDLLHAVRKFMTTDVAPVLLEHWSRATFPVEIVPGMRRAGNRGPAVPRLRLRRSAVTCSTA